MSGFDIFAWVVLVILIASIIAVFCIMGWLPGHIARERGHPQAQAVTVAGWITLIFGFALWPVASSGPMSTCRHGPGRRRSHDDRTDGGLLALLFTCVWLGLIRFTTFWKASPFIVLLLLNILLFIPMGWGAPQGSALVVRNSVAIVPDVAGEVLDVPVAANVPLKAGDVLFRIDPTPFKSQVDALEAQLKFQDLRLSQMTQLQQRDFGRMFDVEQRQSEVDHLQAQLVGARWNLEKTVVRAPADGYVTNLALRKGARVGNLPLSPAMATHRHIGHHHRRGDRADRRALHQGGPGCRGHLQISPRQNFQRQG